MKVIFTTALTEAYYDQRKDEYLDSYKSLCSMIDPSNVEIVECYSGKGTNFFETELGIPVYYTETNRTEIKNQGVREAIALKKYLENCSSDDSEMMIKQTGRYRFTSNFFIKEVHESDADILVRKTEDGQSFFGAIAMTKKNFLLFLNQLDLDKMEEMSINIERELSDFIERNNLTEKKYSRIEMFSNIANNFKFNW